VSDQNIDIEYAGLAANTLRLLAVDGVQKANSGHPGMPMGMADVAFMLWSRYLKHNPADPQWANRDRFILSAGHGSMLLYALLHLSGYAVTIEDLAQFRQWGSKTPGHPEHGCLPGVETTTGPLGQGFATGVGMAIAAKMTAARFNTADQQIFGTHRIYGIVSDGDLMEGLSHEAASLAGHLKLGNIIYFYDDNHITIEGGTDLAFTESVAKRFEAYNWLVTKIDGHDYFEIADAIEEALADSERPKLIIARTHIGFGSPNKHDTSECHGSPLGPDEVKATKRNLGFNEEQSFYVPEEVSRLFAERRQELEKIYADWQAEYQKWRTAHPELAQKYDEMQNQILTAAQEEEIIKAVPTEAMATRALSGKIMQKMAELLASFCGGSADLAPSTSTYLKSLGDIAADEFGGRNFHFGIREHAMGAILNGMALYGGFIPFGATFLVFSDYMRPTIRLAAMMKLRVVYVFTHDSIFVGEDGPTHQPIEQVAALRIIPNLTVIRPADGLEVAQAWIDAVNNLSGPTALILTRQKVAVLNRVENFDRRLISRGGYVIVKEQGCCPELILVATGSEVGPALEAQKILQAEGRSVRVVSMPSTEKFKRQDEAYRESVIPAGSIPVVVIEAGLSNGWGDLVRNPLHVICIDRFGASGPEKILADKFGFTAQKIVERIKGWQV
jgi:transketolase